MDTDYVQTVKRLLHRIRGKNSTPSLMGSTIKTTSPTPIARSPNLTEVIRRRPRELSIDELQDDEYSSFLRRHEVNMTTRRRQETRSCFIEKPSEDTGDWSINRLERKINNKPRINSMQLNQEGRKKSNASQKSILSIVRQRQNMTAECPKLGGNSSINHSNASPEQLPARSDTALTPTTPRSRDKEAAGSPTAPASSRHSVFASKSMPLSPTSKNEHLLDRQLQGLHVKLDGIKSDLLLMRKQDQKLAKRLLEMYTEIQNIKMNSRFPTKNGLLYHTIVDADSDDEDSDVCDEATLSKNRLVLCDAVTCYNLSSRRFSCI